MVGGVRCVVRDASQAYADARMWCLWSPLSKLVFWPYQTGPYDEPFDEPYLNLSSKKRSRPEGRCMLRRHRSLPLDEV